MKIVYCIPATYSAGGMERVLALKANYLSNNGYDVTIITTDQKSRPDFYDINQNIRRYDLNINYEDNRNRTFMLKLVHYLYNKIKHRYKLRNILYEIRADVAISMFRNEMPHLIKITDGSKKILESHVSWQSFIVNRRKGIMRLFDIIQERRILRRVNLYDRVVLLTKEDQKKWNTLGVKNTIVINNPRTFEMSLPSTLKSKQALAIGRLDVEKGFDRLISLWSKIHILCPDWRLHIYGDGPLKGELQKMIDESNASGSIILKGVATNIQSIIKDHSLLMMTSIYEGLPMVLLEAQACGLPILSLDFPCGPKDVIENGVSGFVVSSSNTTEFVNRAVNLMSDWELRKRMGLAALKNSKRFCLDEIMKQWCMLFESLL